jgi:hypothetical protein
MDRLPTATWRALALDLACEAWGEDMPEDERWARLASRTDILKRAGLIQRAAPKTCPRADPDA